MKMRNFVIVTIWNKTSLSFYFFSVNALFIHFTLFLSNFICLLIVCMVLDLVL